MAGVQSRSLHLFPWRQRHERERHLGTPYRTRSFGVGGCFPSQFPLYIYIYINAKFPTLPMWVTHCTSHYSFSLSLSIYLSHRSSLSRDPSVSLFSFGTAEQKMAKNVGILAIDIYFPPACVQQVFPPTFIFSLFFWFVCFRNFFKNNLGSCLLSHGNFVFPLVLVLLA